MGGVKASASGSAAAAAAKVASSSPAKSVPKRTKKSKGKKGKQREEVVEASEEEQDADGDEQADSTMMQLVQKNTEMDTTAVSASDWPVLRLSEPAGSSSSLPAVFSRDGR